MNQNVFNMYKTQLQIILSDLISKSMTGVNLAVEDANSKFDFQLASQLIVDVDAISAWLTNWQWSVLDSKKQRTKFINISLKMSLMLAIHHWLCHHKWYSGCPQRIKLDSYYPAKIPVDLSQHGSSLYSELFKITCMLAIFSNLTPCSPI